MVVGHTTLNKLNGNKLSPNSRLKFC